jgi:hypothetical protein
MCTVSFIARKTGYALAMNRDEKLTRVAGLPPSKKTINGRTIISPAEPGGGTWIAVNDSGVTFALINWYSVKAKVKSSPVSRGKVVNAVCSLDSPNAASATLARLPLKKINPFRLVGFFPMTQEVIEWQWDLQELARKKHRWQAQQWISSGFDEPVAERVRGGIFRRMLKDESAGSLAWLRRLHRSHSPQTGPFSTCMHRADAATVSYTEVAVSAKNSMMRFRAEAPCKPSRLDVQQMQRRRRLERAK